MPNNVDVLDEEEIEENGIYWSFPVGSEPWPDSYQPDVWTDGDDFIFATDELQLLAYIQEAYETAELEIPESINGWWKLKPTFELAWVVDEDDEDCQVVIAVEDLLMIGRITGMGVWICGDPEGPFWMWGGVCGWK